MSVAGVTLQPQPRSTCTSASSASGSLSTTSTLSPASAGAPPSLPHNGAVITLLAVSGLTHRQAYKDIFAITIIKTLAVFVVIGLFYATGWV